MVSIDASSLGIREPEQPDTTTGGATVRRAVELAHDGLDSRAGDRAATGDSSLSSGLGDILARFGRALDGVRWPDALDTAGQAWGERFSQPQPVTDGLDALETATAATVDAYNDLQSFLSANAARLDPGLSATLRRPLRDLAALGVRETASGQAWVDGDTFLASVLADPDGANATLLGAEGLIPAWQGAVAEARGAERWIVREPVSPAAPWSRIERNDQDERLLDLLG